MANEPVFLTVDEAASLQAAVGRIVSTGIRVQDSDFALPDGEMDGTAAKIQDPPVNRHDGEGA
jgi:hypothetical protein